MYLKHPHRPAVSWLTRKTKRKCQHVRSCQTVQPHASIFVVLWLATPTSFVPPQAFVLACTSEAHRRTGHHHRQPPVPASSFLGRHPEESRRLHRPSPSLQRVPSSPHCLACEFIELPVPYSFHLRSSTPRSQASFPPLARYLALHHAPAADFRPDPSSPPSAPTNTPTVLYII
ncbi:hypothetical protein CC80DRAFT_280022 [Byssothecium circinans]|uniref:Uncharacterized protein n=1 Tax=Byssothecium circinans TaxID=147558 RepID=A0A6A5T861_9PLEO|nr:hypothetical protein CC80DRAFT_280022 [Byssothecium circinans]